MELINIVGHWFESNHARCPQGATAGRPHASPKPSSFYVSDNNSET
jgi:hypothetical protein